MMHRRTFQAFGLFFAFAALAALPVAAAPASIEQGIDLWRTTSDGSTQASFQFEPIPAGFFCEASEAFTGILRFKGVPVATSPEGLLGYTDTVVHRLDDAIFDERGFATTRLQVRALNFAALEDFQNACGRYNVTVSLAGEQPVTEMKILREDENGGAYVAPISVNVRMTFTPVGIAAKGLSALTLDRRLDLRAIPGAKWVHADAAGIDTFATKGALFVDTDGDHQPDSQLPGTSNFIAGVGLDVQGKAAVIDGCHCDYQTCGHLHCINYCPPHELCIAPIER